MFPCLYFHSSGLILFIPTVLIFLLGFGSFSNRFLRKVEHATLHGGRGEQHFVHGIKIANQMPLK